MATKASRDIRVRYSSIDRYSESRRFKTLAGAQRYAQKFVGETPEISGAFSYAVSADGIGKITVSGATLAELFPSSAESHPATEYPLGYMQGRGAS